MGLAIEAQNKIINVVKTNEKRKPRSNRTNEQRVGDSSLADWHRPELALWRTQGKCGNCKLKKKVEIVI